MVFHGGRAVVNDLRLGEPSAHYVAVKDEVNGPEEAYLEGGLWRASGSLGCGSSVRDAGREP